MSFVLVSHPVPEVAVVTLNRPERMNSMAFDMMVPLRRTLEEVGYSNEVRAIVLTGAGGGFCSGADQKSVGKPPGVEGVTRPTYGLRTMELMDDVVLTLRKLHQPVIAAVNGAAIGGGLCLALACDLRVCAPNAYFRAAGINNGLTASELGLSYLLPRAIGSTRAADLMFTGRDMEAAEAREAGLVSEVTAHHDDEAAVPPADGAADPASTVLARPVVRRAIEIGQTIAGYSQPGIELTKRTLWSGMAASSLEAHMQTEGIGQLYVRLLTNNFDEAIAARKKGRPATFTDTL